ncbi:long-chain fatty acid--CoA ligase [Variovorax sp. EBFNA2]|uniref:AMP-dependent synthetase/ligase n=1 Tax=Variovorax sp. EBFNA2 TaxID=3342097 RepID=UPI0029BFBBBB|nr:long-chain fatty acid--CoA ligase [Variovorax boronicumulans]WPG36299.1 long-chain fatty acid--CoA ligase [Variovorax boronicumulans]
MATPPSFAPVPADIDTVPRLFRHAVATRGDAVMLRQKELGIWRAYTYAEVGLIVDEMARGLAALGLRPGDVMSVLSNTCREWLWMDLAGLTAGAVVNGIYPTDAATQVEFLCQDSGSTLLVVENEEQLDKFLEVQARLPAVRHVIVFDMEGLARLDDARVLSLDALRELGRTHRATQPALLDERIASRGPTDLAVLVYTSGTTGRPKGAMISHANVMAASRTLQAFLPRTSLRERAAFLPLCHVSERIFGEYYALLAGQTLNFVEDPETIFDNIREIQPDVFMAVPRIWEKLYSSVSTAMREATRLEQWACRRALAVGERVAGHRERREAVPTLLRARHWLARKLVLDNLRSLMGLGRVELAITGAAPISADLIRWYMALGIELNELWGMTEVTGAATCNPQGRSRPGSIGLPLPGSEVRLSPQGELQVRGGQVFMGYLNLPEKTAEAFEDGWLRTGDVGRMDDDGYFYITDRMKDIIITAGGKNVTPSEWENQLKFSPYVTDAVVIGDKRAYLSCLVMIDQDNVEQWAQERSVAFSDYRSLTRSHEVVSLIAEEIEKVNRHFARVEQIKQFRLLENRLSAEDEELTPTMKLKRSLVNRKYAVLIDSMYEDRAA